MKKFMKLHHYISVMGWPGPSMAARHAAPELKGNQPFGVPLRLKNGKTAWWRILTSEGCSLPTRQSVKMAMGDGRGLILLSWLAVQGQKLLLSHDKVQGVFDTSKIRAIEFGLVRWSSAEIHQHYAKQSPYISHEALPMTVNEWCSVNGVMAPNDEFATEVLPTEFGLDATMKTLIDNSEDSFYNSKGLDAKQRHLMKCNPPGNQTRAWYSVVRFQTGGAIVGSFDEPGDFFLSCLVQLVIDWVMGGNVPTWILRGLGVGPNPDFLNRLAAAIALMGPETTMAAIRDYQGRLPGSNL